MKAASTRKARRGFFDAVFEAGGLKEPLADPF